MFIHQKITLLEAKKTFTLLLCFTLLILCLNIPQALSQHSNYGPDHIIGEPAGDLPDLSPYIFGPNNKLIINSEVLLITTHAEEKWDGAESIQRKIKSLNQKWTQQGFPTLFLSSDPDNYIGLVSEYDLSFIAYSSGSVHLESTPRLKEIWLAGGYFTLCLGSTLSSSLEYWNQRAGSQMRINYISETVFEESTVSWKEASQKKLPWYHSMSTYLKKVPHTERINILKSKLKPWVDHHVTRGKVILKYEGQEETLREPTGEEDFGQLVIAVEHNTTIKQSIENLLQRHPDLDQETEYIFDVQKID